MHGTPEVMYTVREMSLLDPVAESDLDPATAEVEFENFALHSGLVHTDPWLD